MRSLGRGEGRSISPQQSMTRTKEPLGVAERLCPALDEGMRAAGDISARPSAAWARRLRGQPRYANEHRDSQDRDGR
jgi:hypothetical protein